MIFLEAAFDPMAVMAGIGGPINTTPAAAHCSAKPRKFRENSTYFMFFCEFENNLKNYKIEVFDLLGGFKI